MFCSREAAGCPPAELVLELTAPRRCGPPRSPPSGAGSPPQSSSAPPAGSPTRAPSEWRSSAEDTRGRASRQLLCKTKNAGRGYSPRKGLSKRPRDSRGTTTHTVPERYATQPRATVWLTGTGHQRRAINSSGGGGPTRPLSCPWATGGDTDTVPV